MMKMVKMQIIVHCVSDRDSKKNAAFGGCKAGNTTNGQNDIIQLEAGEYKLSLGELVPENRNYDSRQKSLEF